MTTNAQAALIAAASTMTPTNGDWHAEYGCKLIEARAQHFLTWLDAADKQPAPVIVPEYVDRHKPWCQAVGHPGPCLPETGIRLIRGNDQ